MEKKLVFVVEDNHMMCGLISSMLKKNGASFIIAHNLNDALSLFKANKTSITDILLDGSLTERIPGQPLPLNPDTLPLAVEIANADDFCGLVYPMSSMPDYTDALLKALGSKGVLIGEASNKNSVISEFIKLINKG